MELVDIGESLIRNTGLYVAMDVYSNNFLTGLKVLIPLDDVLFAKAVTKNLLERRGVLGSGLKNIRDESILATGSAS